MEGVWHRLCETTPNGKVSQVGRRFASAFGCKQKVPVQIVTTYAKIQIEDLIKSDKLGLLEFIHIGLLKSKFPSLLLCSPEDLGELQKAVLTAVVSSCLTKSAFGRDEDAMARLFDEWLRERLDPPGMCCPGNKERLSSRLRMTFGKLRSVVIY